MENPNSNISVGEYKVRTDFNVSHNNVVKTIKDKTAELINLINRLTPNETNTERDSGEFARLKAIAMTEYESAAMWAVKAATV